MTFDLMFCDVCTYNYFPGEECNNQDLDRLGCCVNFKLKDKKENGDS